MVLAHIVQALVCELLASRFAKRALRQVISKAESASAVGRMKDCWGCSSRLLRRRWSRAVPGATRMFVSRMVAAGDGPQMCPNRMLSTAPELWRKGQAWHAPGKVLLNVALPVVLGGDCLADAGCCGPSPGAGS